MTAYSTVLSTQNPTPSWSTDRSKDSSLQTVQLDRKSCHEQLRLPAYSFSQKSAWAHMLTNESMLTRWRLQFWMDFRDPKSSTSRMNAIKDTYGRHRANYRCRRDCTTIDWIYEIGGSLQDATNLTIKRSAKFKREWYYHWPGFSTIEDPCRSSGNMLPLAQSICWTNWENHCQHWASHTRMAIQSKTYTADTVYPMKSAPKVSLNVGRCIVSGAGTRKGFDISICKFCNVGND